MPGTYEVGSDELRGEAARYRAATVDRFGKAAEAMGIVKAGNPDMYGPLLQDRVAELEASFAAVTAAMTALSALAESIPASLNRAADAYDQADDTQRRRFGG